MSMSWDNTCCRCKKDFSSWGPDTICSDCWTSKDTLDRENYLKRYNEEQEENTAKHNLEKIPKWIRKMFGCI